jgi:hypothetical protein
MNGSKMSCEKASIFSICALTGTLTPIARWWMLLSGFTEAGRAETVSLTAHENSPYSIPLPRMELPKPVRRID